MDEFAGVLYVVNFGNPCMAYKSMGSSDAMKSKIKKKKVEASNGYTNSPIYANFTNYLQMIDWLLEYVPKQLQATLLICDLIIRRSRVAACCSESQLHHLLFLD